MSWYSDAPKQWLFNAYQNQGTKCPPLRSQRIPGGLFRCVLHLSPTQTVNGEGRDSKDAEKSAAMQACAILEQRGLLKRAVSTKQNSKSKKKKKKGNTKQTLSRVYERYINNTRTVY